MNKTWIRSRRARPHRAPAERRAGLGRILAPCVVLLLCLPLGACGPSECDEAMAIVQTAYDRLNDGDVDGYLGYYSEDAVMLNLSGERVPREAGRAELTYALAHDYHFKISDLACKDNVVTFTHEAFFRETNMAKFDLAYVVVDGRIIFDGTEIFLRAECDRDPSQAFCL